MSSYKKIFCSFASSNLWRSLERIKKQAEDMHVYDQIYVYDEHDLDIEFKKHFKDKLIPSRGFGYWVWKPQVILQALEKMNDGDILQYADAGCHLNKRGVKRLNEYFEMANTSGTGILAFQSKKPDDERLLKALDIPEKQWTKGDVFDYFGVRSSKEIYESEQISAGILFVKKTEESVSIIREFLQVFYDDFSLADDSPSKAPNFNGFIENRHDQSIFSIITKKYNILTVSCYEFWQLDFNFYKLKYYPIWAIRDKDNGGDNLLKKIQKKLKKISLVRFVYYTLKRWKHYFFPYEIERITKTKR
ncbi:MAG: hypothetical protein LBL94_10095 [Prevotellaceae bacterium]|jgi:hypothetical protein|nr:hypothetical protein [Prevotellaceae bacterium]